MAYTNAKVTVDLETGPDVRGLKFAKGTMAVGTYQTGGVNMHLENVFLSTSKPFVEVKAASGYMLEWVKHKTAIGGLVKAYYSSVNSKNGANEVLALVEVANATNLAAINAEWFALGQSY